MMHDFLVPPALVETFARGWATTRGVEPPIPEGAALRIETGQPHETRRYIFARPPAGIRAIAASITEPGILLKAAMAPELVAQHLPPHWHVEQTGTTMTVQSLPHAPCPLVHGFTLAAHWQAAIYSVRIMGLDGSEAARGRMTLVDGWALHDNIYVAEQLRRHGLGRAVMTALGTEAGRRDINRGLLNATAAGRALYKTMGWTARAPWVTAQISA